MRIGIIIAMDKEFGRIKALLENPKDIERGGRRYTVGTTGCNELVLHQCGIGKVNAAIGATELLTGFSPDAVVSTGVAGGAATTLGIGEVVAAAQTCYHDVYCGEEQAYGQIPGMQERFDADPRLLRTALSLDCGTKITSGLTVTGDWFVDSRDKMRNIISHFPEAAAVDMESAAIAHACAQRNVPFISFRIISDIPLSDHKARQYFNFWETAADSSFEVTKAFIERI